MGSLGRCCNTVLLIFVMVELCIAQHEICPYGFGENIQDVFGASKFIQQGIWHRIPCTEFRPGEEHEGVIWYKGSNIDDPSKVHLISRTVSEAFPSSDRYVFSSDSSLVIKSVEKGDEGRYLCQVIPQLTGPRVATIDLHVLGESFPARTPVESSSDTFKLGRRQTLHCHRALQTQDAQSVVYWSTGEGVTTDTEIIAARFSDGTVLKMKHDADYSIGSDGSSLKVNPMGGVDNDQRYWCHVFLSDDTLTSCFTNVQISDGQSDHAFKSAPSSFYLLKGTEQSVPCTSWTAGNTACEIKWFKVDSSGEHLLVSSNDVDTDSGFELTSEFGLIIKSVDDDDAGTYNCYAVPSTSGDDIDVRVIGDKFPLDNGMVLASPSFIFQDGNNYTLTCRAKPNSTEIASDAILFWSFGAFDEQATIVIGKLNALDGVKTMSELGGDGCYDISSNGSLLLTNCSQDDDVRYWCHVFSENDMLSRSYVDAVIETQSHTLLIIIVGCVSLMIMLIIVVIGVILYMRCYKQRSKDRRLFGSLKEQLDELEKEALEYVQCRKNTIKMLQETADQLKDVYDQAQKAQVAGGGIGLAGTVLTVVGLGASLFTFGSSLALTVFGAALGAAGGATTVAGTLVEVHASKTATERANKILKDDNEAVKHIEDGLKQINTTLTSLNTSEKGALRVASSIYEFVRVGTAATKIGKAAGQTAFKAVGAISKGMAIGGVLFSVIAIPLDIHTIITSAANLQKDTVPDVAQAIYKTAAELDCPTKEDMMRHLAEIKERVLPLV